MCIYIHLISRCVYVLLLDRILVLVKKVRQHRDQGFLNNESLSTYVCVFNYVCEFRAVILAYETMRALPAMMVSVAGIVNQMPQLPVHD